MLDPNPYPSPLTKWELADICSVAAECFRREWVSGTAGNFSVCDARGVVWQSPSGTGKGQLQPRQFLPVSLASGEPLQPARGRPSAETPLHLGIYRALSARVVVHVHPPHVVKAGADGFAWVFEGKEMQKALGTPTHEEDLQVPMIPNSQDMDDLGRRCEQFLVPEVPVLVLAGHGVYAWGQSAREAFHRAEALEFLCKTR